MPINEFTQKGTIYTHASGSFRIRERKGRAYEVEYSDRPALWISTGSKDFDEAEAFAIAKLHSQMRFMPGEKVMLGSVAKEFFSKEGEGSYKERCRRFGKRHEDKYFRAKQGWLDNYIIPRFGSHDVRSIKSSDIEDWYVGLTSFRHPGEKLSDDTKVSILEAFDDLMKDLKRRGIIETNPCSEVQRITIHKEKNRTIFTQEEIALLFPNDREKLLDIWDGSMMWALYFSIMVDTGFRPGEVAGLQRQSFDDNGGVYTSSGVDSETRQLKGRIKTSDKGKGTKYGILSSYTMDLLDDYLKELKGDALFWYNGGYVYPSYANKRLGRACENAGFSLNGRTQYRFRHTFDTMMLNNLGSQLEESDVRDLMAHTGYRPEYDHRTPEQILFRLQKVRPAVESIRKIE